MLLAPMFDPAMIVRVIERERPRLLLGVPTMLVALIDEVDAAGATCRRSQRIMSGGAMVAPELVQEGARDVRRADPDRLRADRDLAGHHPGLATTTAWTI